jgi:hypothetical protein
MPRSGLVQRADGTNHHASRTFGISLAEQARMPEASRDSSPGDVIKKSSSHIFQLCRFPLVFGFGLQP